MAAPFEVADEGTSLRSTLVLPPRMTERISIDVSPSFLGEPVEPWYGLDGQMTEHNPARESSSIWLSSCVELQSENRTVQDAWDRAVAELWSLQSLDGEGSELFTPMGGIPKYGVLFGRDALMASIQSALLNPATLEGSLLSVGEWNATVTDDRYDAQPGKVLHQRQRSPLALLGKTPFLHYYGDYSAPALYIIAAAVHFAHTGDREFFASIQDKINATLDWMDRDGDLDGDGFYEYRTFAGNAVIKNQYWKDSSQAILYADGSYVQNPITAVEVQGLYYAAKQAISAVFFIVGENDRAELLLRQAANLKRRFNERFWMAGHWLFCDGTRPRQKPVRMIASDAASCLAYGIIDEDKSEVVAKRIVALDMFSGWVSARFRLIIQHTIRLPTI